MNNNFILRLEETTCPAIIRTCHRPDRRHDLQERVIRQDSETVNESEEPRAERRHLLEYARNLFDPHFSNVRTNHKDYRVKSQIGSLGSSGGVVFLLENIFTGHHLALKAFIPPAETFDERIDAKLGFTRELHTLEHLTFGSESGRFVDFVDLGGAKYEGPYPPRFEKRKFPKAPNTVLYFIMEYADGGSVSDRINPSSVKDKLSDQQKLSILIQSAEGLFEAHSMRYCHRDIKPQNILLTKDLGVKIADFGIASFARTSRINTRSERDDYKIGGTYLYASPEQQKEMLYFLETGNRVPNFRPDFPTDIYSFGVVAYHLMTEKSPREIKYKSPLKILTHLVSNPIRKKDLVSTGNQDIDAVILRCMRLNGEYTNMRDVFNDLKKVSLN